MIVDIAISLLAVAGFGVALWRTRIVEVAHRASSTTMAGLSAMMDSELDDDAKEVAVRRAGFGLIVQSLNLFWRFCVALAAAAAPVFLADAVGLVSRDAVFALMLRLDYILIVSVAAILLTMLVQRLRRSKDAARSGADRYSMADRFYHMVAFSSPAVLKSVSAIEDRVIRETVPEPAGPPIFITSVARGGTTALLNALHDVPGVATHTYRDMPFLTAPILWGRVSGGKSRGVERHQRAHGDGLEIDLDSPEAFEEVLWKMFWPEKFAGPSIRLWTEEDRKPEAERFMRRHMAKLVRARTAGGKAARYCSKNNANIARIPYLSEAFQGCRIVVPVRRPESHAASLLRQHRNFLKLQAEDEFIRRYMRDIGHFEFGQIHKPLGFEGFHAGAHDPAGGDYWLNYWIHAFRAVLAQKDRCVFVLQDDLRAAPQETMEALCGALDLRQGPMEFGSYFRSGADRTAGDHFDPALLEAAAGLYRAFEGLAVSPELGVANAAPR